MQFSVQAQKSETPEERNLRIVSEQGVPHAAAIVEILKPFDQATAAGPMPFAIVNGEVVPLASAVKRLRDQAPELDGLFDAGARVKDFQPKRLVQWFQDELVHFREGQEGDDHFTLHDFRRTTITDLQMAGVSEKETSLLVGATPDVIRKHYEKLEAMTIAKRAAQKRLAANHQSPAFVAPVARGCKRA